MLLYCHCTPRARALCLCRQCKETYSLIASWSTRQYDIDTLCKGIEDIVLFNLLTQQSSLDVPTFANMQADHLHKVIYVLSDVHYLLLKQVVDLLDSLTCNI